MEQKDLINALQELLPEDRVKMRLIDLVSYASDAGCYHLLPKAIVQPVNEDEIIALFRFSHQSNIPLVFRAAGTSLSGQSITDGILVDIGRHWKNITVEEDGNKVKVAPGAIGAMVNARLRQYHRKIGPDPSSISAAMMGGILSNNASGMCCGVQYNSYHTIAAIRFVLPNGKTFSSSNETDARRFELECADIAHELLSIRNQILADAALVDKIRNKYKIKNTVGYALNAFLDYDTPVEIFAHLLIGGEGTLAFISEAVMTTIADEPYKATALLYYADIFAACASIQPLVSAGAAMVELMDRASLRAIEQLHGIDPAIKELPDAAAALLIEFQESGLSALEEKVNGFLGMPANARLLNAPTFTSDAVEREFLWKIRKGLFPAVGAVRKSGTSVILEDVAFPLQHLGDAILDLQGLFKKYDYINAIIFGHAKDGNLHFVITQSFNTGSEVDRYDRFLREVVDIVVNKYDGSLKAEHGTGRNMAPFVETEWGSEAYNIMKRVKAIADPHNLLNPGVVINEDAQAHLKNLKQMPGVEQEVDKCIECGYCEPVCPSRDITLTPRRRIVVRRAMEIFNREGKQRAVDILAKQYEYDGIETCAVDGLCATACPVDINTGDLIKRLRRENHSASANKVALFIAKHFAIAERAARLGIQLGVLINKLTGKNGMRRITGGVRRIFPSLPLWSNQLAAPPSMKSLIAFKSVAAGRNSNARYEAGAARKGIVYFPACITRTMGNATNLEGAGGKVVTIGEAGAGLAGCDNNKKDHLSTFMGIARFAGIEVAVPPNIVGVCCGQIFSSKGFSSAYIYTANKWMNSLWEISKEGKWPIVTDVSSCAYTLHHIRPVLSAENKLRFDALTIMDSIEFIHKMILPVCDNVGKKDQVVLHPVCSLKKMGTESMFVDIAKHFADTVIVPQSAGCCGMAGDRGFLFPELTQSATAHEAFEVSQTPSQGYYSSTRTCEISMSDATHQNYESILYLVAESLIANPPGYTGPTTNLTTF